VYHICFSPDGNTIVTCGQDGTVRLWDSQSGRQLRIFSPPSKRQTGTACFSPGGEYVAALSSLSSDDGANEDSWTLHVLDANTWKELASASWLKSPWTPLLGRQHICFSPDGMFLAVACNGREVRIWETKGFEKVDGVNLPDELPNCISFSHDSTRLAIASGRSVALRTIGSLEATHWFSGHDGEVRCLAFSPDDSLLATGSSDMRVKLWPAELVEEPEVDEASVKKRLAELQFHGVPHGGRVLSVSGNTACVSFPGGEDRREKEFEHDISQQVTCPDGIHVITTFGTSESHFKMTVWNLLTLQTEKELEGHTDFVVSFAFSPNGERLLTGSGDSQLILWDVPTWTQLAHINAHRDFFVDALDGAGACFTRDGSRFLSWGEDGVVRIWDANATELALLTPRGYENPAIDRILEGAAFGGDYSWITAVDNEDRVNVWMVAPWRPEQPQESDEDSSAEEQRWRGRLAQWKTQRYQEWLKTHRLARAVDQY